MRVPRSLAIYDRRSSVTETLHDWACSLAASGVDAVQIRARDLSDRQLFELATGVAALDLGQTALTINQRFDVAVAVNAEGVHLRSSSAPVAMVRERCPHLLVGKSTHSLDEVRRACDEGAHYVVFGPVFAPLSKVVSTRPVGLEGLERAAALDIPVLALGGLTVDRLGAVAAAGASGVAAISLFQDRERRREILSSIGRIWPPEVRRQ